MMPQQKAHLAMLAFSVLVAGSFPLGGMAANDITPAALNTLRFWIAAGVIGAVALATTGVPATALRAVWRYALLGSLMAAYFVLMFEGLKTAPPVSIAAVFTLTPVLSAGFGFLLLGQVLTGRMLAALVIGAAGALWVIFRGDPAAARALQIDRGEWIYFIGCVSHALYTPMVRRLNRGETALVLTFGTLLAGAILLTIWSWADLRATDWTALPAIVWITIGYTAVIASAVTFTLLQFATLRLPASKVMAYTYLVPVWVIVWDIALGGTAPAAIVLGGVALTCLALVLLLRDDTVRA